MFLHDFATLSTSIPRYGTEYSPRHSNELCSAENDDTRQRDGDGTCTITATAPRTATTWMQTMSARGCMWAGLTCSDAARRSSIIFGLLATLLFLYRGIRRHSRQRRRYRR